MFSIKYFTVANVTNDYTVYKVSKGCIVTKYYMPKHLQTIKHTREMEGRDNIEVVDHHRYKPRN